MRIKTDKKFGWNTDATYYNKVKVAVVMQKNDLKFEDVLKKELTTLDDVYSLVIRNVLDDADDKQFKKCIWEHFGIEIKDYVLPSYASMIYSVYRYIKKLPEHNWCLIRNFDTNLDYWTAKNFLEYLKTHHHRFILTTTNPLWLDNRYMRPDCCYTMSGDNLYQIHTQTMTDLTETKNIPKLYIDGEFEGCNYTETLYPEEKEK